MPVQVSSSISSHKAIITASSSPSSSSPMAVLAPRKTSTIHTSGIRGSSSSSVMNNNSPLNNNSAMNSNSLTNNNGTKTTAAYTRTDKPSNNSNNVDHNYHSQITMMTKLKRLLRIFESANDAQNNNTNTNSPVSGFKMQIGLWMILAAMVSISTFSKLVFTTMKNSLVDKHILFKDEEIPPYGICTSPEKHIPWPFDITASTRIKNSTITTKTNLQTSPKVCGLGEQTNFSKYLKSLHDQFQKNDDCRTVIYGVAFGDHVQFMNDYIHETKRLQQNPCFYMFVLQSDYEQIDDVWEARLIMVDKEILPYQNLRRNVKLFKYTGHLIFSKAKEIIWQDAKFFSKDNIWKQPLFYQNDNNNIISNPNACITVTSLPVHPNSLGEHVKDFTTELSSSQQFMYHCETIIATLEKRPDVTDSAENLLQQCHSYLHRVRKNSDNYDMSVLNVGLFDSAFIVWNYRNEKCYEFNSKLQCAVLDQIHCHSDRDQVSLPFVLYQMNLRLKDPNPNLDSRITDIQLIDQTNNNNNNVMVHMIRSQCHWYFSRIGDCPFIVNNSSSSSIPYVAVIVAGSLKRFQFNSTLYHLFKPAYRKFKMDYYVTLSTSKPLAFRQGNHMDHLSYDPIFAGSVYNVRQQFIDSIREQLDRLNVFSGAIDVRSKAPSQFYANNSPLRVRQRRAKRLRPKEDVDARFPMLDLRKKAKRRTAIGNKNMLNLFFRYEFLWVNKVLTTEHMIGQQYDYVLILRDDTYWLQDVNIQSIIDYDQGRADMYILSCNARNPPLLPCEVNDHAILVRRSKAEIFTKYFTTLLSLDIQACHTSVQPFLGKDRGCNSEMILNFVIQTHNVTVQRIPQSLLPFQRALTVRHSGDGRLETCLHKLCQSIELPLQIPSSLRKCQDLDSEFR